MSAHGESNPRESGQTPGESGSPEPGPGRPPRSGGAARATRRLAVRRTAALFSGLLLLSAALLIWSVKRPDSKVLFQGQPHAYKYEEYVSSEGVRLHLMRVAPGDVELRAAGVPLKETAAYGINGGFFYEKALLSIAIMNDRPAGGDERGPGSGWFNAKYARGTLVWDGASRLFSVQVVSSGDDIAVLDRGHYWAQGGVSMNLGDEAGWTAAAAAQRLPFSEERRLRSGMVYNAAGELRLIVSSTLCTGEAFRRAVLEAVPGEGREGIYLDGDGSSQMNADEAVLTGDGRPVMQMIAVKPAIVKEAE
ncbi:hypothetical protein [Paenibacillus spiritus]|uniref:hypothetical protein n=1 Tax=Paenibacillus spiritus TaxID=2496557 RepID=UPI001CC5DD99|nr:hypothetical protein [Paenibacillus spiritus]